MINYLQRAKCEINIAKSPLVSLDYYNSICFSTGKRVKVKQIHHVLLPFDRPWSSDCTFIVDDSVSIYNRFATARIISHGFSSDIAKALGIIQWGSPIDICVTSDLAS